MRHKLLLPLLAPLLLLFCASCQNSHKSQYPADIEEKIKQVENNLGGWVRTQNDVPWNLE